MTKKQVGVIDLTPTWVETARIIEALFLNGNVEGREAARSELYRMAQIADAYVSMSKEKTDDQKAD